MHDRTPLLVTALVLGGTVSTALAGGVEVDPAFSNHYTVFDLGAVPGVPGPYGGIAFRPDDPNRILIGGRANDPEAAIYEIEVERGCAGAVRGFVGVAMRMADASEIDGGLVFDPDRVLFYSTYSSGLVGQIMPGAEGPDRIFRLEDFGVDSSTGTLMFVPEGFAGAGRLKLTTLDTDGWYDASIAPDGAGKPYLEAVTKVTVVPGGPDGTAYVAAGNPRFDHESVLIAGQRSGRVDAYATDGSGDPINATRRVLVRGVTGARGMATDPQTDHVLIVASGGAGNHIYLLRGFVGPCAADVAPEGGDGVIDTTDLIRVLSAWDETCSDADVNDDGTVGFDDVQAVLATWGTCGG